VQVFSFLAEKRKEKFHEELCQHISGLYFSRGLNGSLGEEGNENTYLKA